MNVLILYDLEGVIGVKNLNDNAYNSELIKTEIDIVVQELKEKGADKITICEVHNGGSLKLINSVWKNVEVIYGIENVDFNNAYKLGLLLGFHTRSGMQKAFSHTMRPDIKTVWFNGYEIGEISLFTYWLRNHGIPVVLCSGEMGIEEETERLKLENVITDLHCKKQELYEIFRQKIRNIKVKEKYFGARAEGIIEIVPLNQDVLEEMKRENFHCNRVGICFESFDELIMNMNLFCEAMNKANIVVYEKNYKFIMELKQVIRERQLEKTDLTKLFDVPITHLDNKKRNEIRSAIVHSY